MSRRFAVLIRLLRFVAAAALLVHLASDLPAMRARARLDALPDYDYAAEAERLRAQERFSEALLVVDTGLAHAGDGDARGRLEGQRQRIIDERDDWARRLRETGLGAITGRGQSTEALTGAVVADLFVFGDLRDLVIQGGHAARGEEVDDIIVALSAAGLALSALPVADFGIALLKFARRAGALSERFAHSLRRIVQGALEQRRFGPLMQVADDAATLGRRAGPGAAMAILRNVDDAADLRRAAQFSMQPGGGFALWLGGGPALGWLKANGASGEAVLLRAARKGRPGLQMLARNGRLLARPHPFVGLLKGVYKGNVPRLLQQSLLRWAEPLLAFAIAWVAFELLWLIVGLRRAQRPRAAAPSAP